MTDCFQDLHDAPRALRTICEGHDAHYQGKAAWWLRLLPANEHMALGTDVSARHSLPYPTITLHCTD